MRLLAAVACVVAFPVLAGGQSLGDVARKEKDRRDKARTASPAPPTYTEDSLASAKGGLLSSDVGNAAPSPRVSPAPSAAGDEGRRADAEGYWRMRAARARHRVAAAQEAYDSLDRQIRIGQPARTDENGLRVIYSQRDMKEMADRAQTELAEARKALEDLFDEARRAGALPGWLR